MNRSIKIFLITVLFYTNAISQTVINEIMYAPSDATNEWFEIRNNGSVQEDLLNWKWKDATSSIRIITTRSILLAPGSFAVICQDSVKLKIQFPSLNGIIIQTQWSALNNSGDNVILIDAGNARKDSVSFLPGWGGNTGGYSLEKINSSGASNEQNNWGSCIDILHATPCKQNSITPKPYDLYLKSFAYEPLFPSSGETLSFDFVIRNSGSNNAENYQLNIYRDSDLDSLPENGELINSHAFSFLSASDSVTHNYSISNLETGYKQYIAKVIYSQDDDTLNNILIRKIYVSNQAGSGGGLVINEIMYDPLANRSEWIELYNATGQTVNLKSWKYKEASSYIVLSREDLYFNPGDYFILAHDSSIYEIFDFLKSPQSNQVVKISAGISLNNTGENISITDSLNNIIDAVYYDPGWNNPEIEDPKGISLERINPSFNSNDRNNWSSCADIKGGTPGLKNSILTVSENSVSEIQIFPNPFSPDGDGHEDFTLIKYKLNATVAQMRIKIFDLKGRVVREIEDNKTSGSEGNFIFNGYGSDDQRLRIGIYILLIEAIDTGGGTVQVLKKPIVVAGKL